MLRVKQLLLKQTHAAFGGDDEMSIKAALWKITPQEADWRPGEAVRNAEEIVRHVAYWKAEYCHQGFGTPKPAPEKSATGDIKQAVALLEDAHRTLVGCLEGCSEEDLARPIPTKCHGESSVNFFSVMIMHDTWHGGQIRTRRSTFRARR